MSVQNSARTISDTDYSKNSLVWPKGNSRSDSRLLASIYLLYVLYKCSLKFSGDVISVFLSMEFPARSPLHPLFPLY